MNISLYAFVIPSKHIFILNTFLNQATKSLQTINKPIPNNFIHKFVSHSFNLSDLCYNLSKQ